MGLRLHEIISILVNDKNLFVSESDIKEKEVDSDHYDNGFKVINMNILKIYQKQSLEYFPAKVRKILPKTSYRLGIEQQDTNEKKINISFLNSINCLLIDDIKSSSPTNQLKYVRDLRKIILRLIPHSRKRDNMRSRVERNMIDNDIIQTICNFFQINLLLVDLIEERCHFFYSYLNDKMLHLYRPLYYISKINDCYEPIFHTDNDNNYLLILNQWEHIEVDNNFTIIGNYMEYLNRIGVSLNTFITLANHLPKRDKDKELQKENDNITGRKYHISRSRKKSN